MSVLETMAVVLVAIPLFAFGLAINIGPHILVWYCARKSVMRIYP